MKRRKINKGLSSCILSDTLPYEMPIIFSNNGFCSLLNRYKVNYKKNNLITSFQETPEWLKILLKLLSFKGDMKSYSYSLFNGYELKDKKIKIKSRYLTIPHPFRQVQIAKMYDDFSDLMICQCQRSQFSIRYPYKTAKFQSTQNNGLPKDIFIAENNNDVLNPKHYFVYKKYQNINAFFDNYQFQRAEKKYSYLVRTDIKHCFDYIKPDLLIKAIYGESATNTKKGFAANFINLQEKIYAGIENDIGWKNGIIIGPEFSRLFAEMILQAVDRDVERKLFEKGYVFNRDYVFYRYVDDGFFFCKYYEDNDLPNIFRYLYYDVLFSWGLRLNRNKIKIYCKKPFLDSITIVKRKLNLMVENMFENRLETNKGIFLMSEYKYDYPFKMSSKYAISDLQGIMKEYDCDYAKISSCLLSYIRTKLNNNVINEFKNIFGEYVRANINNQLDDEGRKIYEIYELTFVDFCCELISFIFYFFSCDPRMGTSIKVGQIISEIIDFICGKQKIDDMLFFLFSIKSKSRIFRKINYELKNLLLNINPGIETANLLLIYHKLPKLYLPNISTLEKMFLNHESLSENISFLTIFTLEHVIGRSYLTKDNKLQIEIKKYIKLKLQKCNCSSSEFVYIFIISLSCPYFDDNFKMELCDIAKIENKKSFIDNSKEYMNIFVNWSWNKMTYFNNNKTSMEVY